MKSHLPDAVANLIGLAKKFQHDNGGFLPFGEICQAGKRTYQAAADEHMTAHQIIRVLDEIYRDKFGQGAMEWATLCIDVYFTDPVKYPGGRDAIQVNYEDDMGRSESYLVPYWQRSAGVYEYDAIIHRQRETRWGVS